MDTDHGIKPEDVLEGDYEIEVAGVRVAADVSLRPMFDPKNEKIRC